MSSMVGLAGAPERAAYASAKAAVVNLTRVLACEWAQYNINVNAICPGFIKTDIIAGLISRGTYHEEDLLRLIPANRLGTPEDIANCAVFLASDESSFITGQAIVVDGGQVIYNYLESWLTATRKK